MLEVYALRASLGTLALQKLMLEAAVPPPSLERELARLLRARRAHARATPPTPTSPTRRRSSRRPGCRAWRVEFERLTWQVRTFLGALEIDLLDDARRA